MGKGIRKPEASHASERIALGELIQTILPRYQRRLRPHRAPPVTMVARTVVSIFHQASPPWCGDDVV